MIECAPFAAVVVHLLDAEHELPHDAAEAALPPELPLMRQLPPFEVDAATGTVAGVLGGLEMFGRAVRSLAELLPGASVVAARVRDERPRGAARPRRPA